MKNELGGKITTKFVVLRAKMYSYLKKSKRHRKVCHKKTT